MVVFAAERLRGRRRAYDAHQQPHRGAHETSTPSVTTTSNRGSRAPGHDAKWQDTGLVFTNRWRGPLHQSRANQALARALERAALPRIRVHDLRHTAATALLVLGIHPKLVPEFLGHSSIKTTLDTYSH